MTTAENDGNDDRRKKCETMKRTGRSWKFAKMTRKGDGTTTRADQKVQLKAI